MAIKEIVTEKVVKEITTIVVCDRCGKPAKQFSYGKGLQIPSFYKSRGEMSARWHELSIACCPTCLTMLWKMFNCRGEPFKKA